MKALLHAAFLCLLTLSVKSQTPGYLSKFATASTFNNSVLFQNGNNIGIGTTMPSALLHLNAGALLAEGTIGATPVSGAGTRMMWIPEKAAFRAGAVNGVQWDDIKIGNFSTAFGNNNTAQGLGTVAFGVTNFVSAPYGTSFGYGNNNTGSSSTSFGEFNNIAGNVSTVFGASNTVNGWYTTVFGYSNVATANYTTVFGRANIADKPSATSFGIDNSANGLASTVMGQGNYAKSYAETVIGSFNLDLPAASTDTLNVNDRVFVVGIGRSYGNRKNAMTVFKNGNVSIGVTTAAAQLHTSGTVRFEGLTNNNTQNRIVVADNDGNLSYRDASSLPVPPSNSWGLMGNAGTNNFLGTTDNQPLIVKTNNTEVIRVANNGQVGIGTANPGAKLHVYGANPTILLEGDNQSYYPRLTIKSNAGNGFFENYAVSNYKGGLWMKVQETSGITGIGVSSLGAMVQTTDANVTPLEITAGYNPQVPILQINKSALPAGSNPSNTTDNILLINKDGNLGLGTTTIPTGYKMAVNGNIITEKLTVKLFATWPDYVFANNYKLMPLPTLAKYLAANKHLPNMPSAQQMAAGQGLDVGANQTILVEKVEELTLYAIEADKQIAAQKTETAEQQKQIAAQKAQSLQQQKQIEALQKEMEALKALLLNKK